MNIISPKIRTPVNSNLVKEESLFIATQQQNLQPPFLLNMDKSNPLLT